MSDFENNEVFVFDFDGTIFDTYEKLEEWIKKGGIRNKNATNILEKIKQQEKLSELLEILKKEKVIKNDREFYTLIFNFYLWLLKNEKKKEWKNVEYFFEKIKNRKGKIIIYTNGNPHLLKMLIPSYVLKHVDLIIGQKTKVEEKKRELNGKKSIIKALLKIDPDLLFQLFKAVRNIPKKVKIIELNCSKSEIRENEEEKKKLVEEIKKFGGIVYYFGDHKADEEVARVLNEIGLRTKFIKVKGNHFNEEADIQPLTKERRRGKFIEIFLKQKHKK